MEETTHDDMTTAPDWVPERHRDLVVAVSDLIGRGGASQFRIKISDDGADWVIAATWQDRHIVEQGRDLDRVCMRLVRRMLGGALCRCGRTASMSSTAGRNSCRWRLAGSRFEPGCDVPTIKIEPTSARRGDINALRAAFRAEQARRAR